MKPEQTSDKQTRHGCAVTAEVMPASTALRFVLDPANRVVPDVKQTLPVSEAIWLSPRRSVVQEACEKGIFRRLHPDARWEAALPQQVTWLLRRRLLELLHLARRSGAVTGGYEKVRSRLMRGDAAILLQAVDAAEDGKNKVAGLAKAHAVPIYEVLGRDELAAVTGRENQVHVALKPGGLTDEITALCRLLLAYET